MNEEEIKAMFKNEPRFLGVFAINEVDSVRLKKDSGFVFNTSHRDVTSSGHWISIYKEKNGDVCLIDSLNLKFILDNHYIISFLKCNNINYVKTLVRAVQPSFSALCGIYCIYFIKCFLNDICVNDFVNIFDAKNLFVNDYLVSEYMMKALK